MDYVPSGAMAGSGCSSGNLSSMKTSHGGTYAVAVPAEGPSVTYYVGACPAMEGSDESRSNPRYSALASLKRPAQVLVDVFPFLPTVPIT